MSLRGVMPSQSDPLTAAMAQMVASDDQLRDELRQLIRSLLDQAWRIVEYGKPADRIALMRTTIPLMLKSMNGADANAGEAVLIERFEQVMSKMRGEG